MYFSAGIKTTTLLRKIRRYDTLTYVTRKSTLFRDAKIKRGKTAAQRLGYLSSTWHTSTQGAATEETLEIQIDFVVEE